MKVRKVLTLMGGIAGVALAITAFGAPTAIALGNDNDPDVIEVRHYQLTMDKAQKAATAMQAINQLVASNPALNGAMSSDSSTGKEPITQQAQTIDSRYPQVAAIIHQNGLQTREFIVVTGAIINDVGWVGMKKQGMIQAYPSGMITPQNAALIEGNWDAFQQIAAKMAPPQS
ncbi:MAG: hypothetical protein ABSA85_01110 [Terracidiphilus sp.]|jgi:hypothetical protein